jgi:peptidoglycan-associated lipoprotein
MKNFRLILILTAIGVAVTGCSKRTALAPPPLDNTVVATNDTGAGAPRLQTSGTKQEGTGSGTTFVPTFVEAPSNNRLPANQRVEIDKLLALLEDALFDYNEATIRPDASAALRDNLSIVREILAGYPADKLLIEGHADERGSSEYNIALGNRRARAAQEFLVAMGTPGTQLSVISLGEERPVCTDQNENCWQQNRRAHISVAP